MENYPNKIYAIIALQQRGYDLDFIVNDGCLFCLQKQELVNADEFEIAESHEFAGKLGACELIYGIRSVQMDLKGILITFCKKRPLRYPCKLPEILKP